MLAAGGPKAGKEATEDILALLPAEESPYLTPVMPKEDILTPALQATQTHTEKAIEAINVQLSALVHRHIPPQQARVFLASLLQVMCSYQQEMDGMATSQVILPGQIVSNLWGVSRTMMEGLTLLGPPNCPASWPASLVERVSAEPIKKATLAGLTPPVKHNTSIPKGKLNPGSSGKKLAPPKRIAKYWDDDERKKEDEESHQREEERCKKKPSGPMLSLDEARRVGFASNFQGCSQPGIPGIQATSPPPSLNASRAEARFGRPVQSGSTPWKMNRCQTRPANRSPRVERRIRLLWS